MHYGGRAWRVQRTRLVHDGGVIAVVFSPNGAWMATASVGTDSAARVFAMRTEKLRAAVIASAPRPLIDAEWRRYGG